VPNYDYVCLNCGCKFEQYFSYSDYGKIPVACPSCQSRQVSRKIGRIRVAKSDDSRMADFSNPESLNGIDEDPQKLGSMMRKMSSQMGEDMGPEFNEVVGRLEKGETPDQIEKELPELGTPGMNPPTSPDDFGDDY
jgi:putative FmdB family regulatory protein